MSEAGEWGEREGGRGKEGRQGKVVDAGQTRESLPRETNGGGREMSTLRISLHNF